MLVWWHLLTWLLVPSAREASLCPVRGEDLGSPGQGDAPSIATAMQMLWKLHPH